MRESKASGNSILRIVFVAVSLLFQVVWILALVLRLNAYSVWLSLLTRFLALAVVLRLAAKHTESAMKLPWIILIMAFPVMGISLYLLMVGFGDLGKAGKRLRRIRQSLYPQLGQDEQTMHHAAEHPQPLAGISQYLWQNAHSPVYENTAVTYYAQAKDAFEALKTELSKAEHFIFMEYFILSDTSAFREILQILADKVKQGVEVRLMYDDVGSIGLVNLQYAKRLNEMGIRCRVFNPVLPVLNVFLNHRDHRKITVIDGKVGFTGGYNLSDEYFDRVRPYGHWKDTGIRMEGEAVRSLTSLFLENWNLNLGREKADAPYLSVCHRVRGEGFVQPFGDDPLGEERVMENLLLQLAYNAKHTLYLMTPYLLITEELNRALCLAAKRGVDVRILTPGIPDKKVVFAMTRSYYGELAAHGVRIFEYTPGFCHGKQCVCDGRIACIGTSNLDYRSLYLHFENNVVLADCEAVLRIEEDFMDTFAL